MDFVLHVDHHLVVIVFGFFLLCWSQVIILPFQRIRSLLTRIRYLLLEQCRPTLVMTFGIEHHKFIHLHFGLFRCTKMDWFYRIVLIFFRMFI